MVERDERTKRKLSILDKRKRKRERLKVTFAISSFILLWVYLLLQIFYLEEGANGMGINEFLNFIISMLG